MTENVPENVRDRFPPKVWPAVDKIEAGQQYRRIHPLTGEERVVTVVEVDTDGPGTIVQSIEE